jgi:photosystem II stability/assembly factor-like uncharacterized protein
MRILVAMDREVIAMDVARGIPIASHGLAICRRVLRRTCWSAGRAWCGTRRGGMFRSDDGGTSWQPVGLAGRLITTVSATPTDPGVVWAGGEPEVWRSPDGGESWEHTGAALGRGRGGCACLDAGRRTPMA